jgi:hypothetical protein
MKPSVIYDLMATATLASKSVPDEFRKSVDKSSAVVGKVIW